MLPTIVWNVAITPIKAHYTLFKESMSDFLVRMCGIVGGIFAAATIFESLVRNGLLFARAESNDNTTVACEMTSQKNRTQNNIRNNTEGAGNGSDADDSE